MTRWARLILLSWLAALSACSHMTRQELDRPAAGPAHEPLQAAVDRLVQPVLAAHETPGVIVAVATPDGGRHFFSYGDGETDGTPLRSDTLFPIGSLTKGYVAALLAVLVNEGQLRWEDTLGEMLPALPMKPEAARLTLLQLATHSAGLPRQPTDLTMLAGLLHFTFTGSNFYGVLNNEGLTRFMARFAPPPHPAPAYSNIGYALIGMAIEARTGRRLGELLADKVLTPLHLSHTSFAPGTTHRAQGHAGDQPYFMPRGRPVADWQFPAAMQGSAALYSTAADLLNFAVAHLDADSVLADNLRVRHAQPQDAPGIAWVTDDVDGFTITNQVGMAVGHTAYLGVLREQRLAVAVLQTSFNWNFKIGHKLLLRLARGQIEWRESTQATVTPPAPIIAAARQDGRPEPATP